MLGMFVPLVVRRALAYARLLAPVLLGTLLATAMTASIAIYTDALRDLGLAHAVRTAEPHSLDLRLSAESPSADRAAYEAGPGLVESEVPRWLPGLVAAPERYARSTTFLVSAPGEPPGSLDVVPRGSFHTLSGAEERLRLLAGSLPSAETRRVDGVLTVEALALEPGARALALGPGDTVAFNPFWEDRTPRVHVRITGVATLADPQDPYWEDPALARLIAEPSLYNTLPLVIREETLVDGVAPAFPKLSAVYAWYYPVDATTLRASNAEETLRSLRVLSGILSRNVRTYRQETGLERLLDSYDTRLRFVQVPLAVFLLMVTAVVLYAVAFLATVVVDRQRTDASFLRSRGAGGRQVFFLYAAQGLLISGVATLLGPFLALGTVSMLGLLPAFDALGHGGLLRVSLSPAAFALAATGGALSLTVLLLPAFQMARRNPLEERRLVARPPQEPLLQRYYLDVGLAGATAVFLWQLGQQGSLVARALTGRGSADLFLLLVPALFLVAAALVLLRLFPLALRVAARLLGPVAPTWLALGLWQLGRNPVQPSRIVLLLVLAAGLGAFAASFGGTLDRSYRERALYQAGADVRLAGLTVPGSGPSFDMGERLAEAPGVRAVSLAFRQSGSFVAGSSTDRFQVLAIEPETFAAVSWWRGDFAQETPQALARRLETDWPTPWSLALPPEAERLGVWARPADPDPQSTLVALIADRHGRNFEVSLGTLESADWRLLEAPLEPSTFGRLPRRGPVLEPAAPLELRALYVVQRARAPGMPAGAFFLDSIEAHGPAGESRTVHRFQDVEGWGVINVGALSRGDALRSVPGGGRDGGPAALFTWGATSGFAHRGIYVGPPDYALPVLVSPGVLRTTGQRVGQTAILGMAGGRYPARIAGTLEHLPTLDPEDGAGFVVANLDDLLRQANLVNRGGEVQPNEAWVALSAPQGARDETLSGLVGVAHPGRVVDQAALLATSHADPLIAAGWGALLLVAYSGVLLLGVVGFVAHAVLTVDERRPQLALLRTLGLGVGHLRALVWFEHLTLVALGTGVGYLLGQRTGTLLMPFLDRTEAGIAVLPPYVLETAWGPLLLVYGLMVLVFALATAAVVRLYNRLALGQVLRMGDE